MQLSEPFANKLDAPLAQLFSDPSYSPSERMPIVVRCERSNLPEMVQEVERLGGEIRHQLRIVAAIAAWIPLRSIAALASDARVDHLELVQTFSIAGT